MANYRRGTFDLTVDSNFQPFSFQEMLAPLAIYDRAYGEAEKEYLDLNAGADKFKYLDTVIPQDSNNPARQIYTNYTNDLQDAIKEFGQSKLNPITASKLLNLKRRYAGEIGQLDEANTKLEKEMASRNDLRAKGIQMYYANENPTISDYLQGSNFNSYSISAEDLNKAGMLLGQQMSSRVYNSGEDGSTLGGLYLKWKETNGVSPESIDTFLQSPEVQNAVKNTLEEKGVTSNLTGDNLRRATLSVYNGLYNGIVYKEDVKPVRDENKLSAAERTRFALQREQMNRNDAEKGLIYNPKTNTYTYDINRDPDVSKMLQYKQAGLASPEGSPDYYNSSFSEKAASILADKNVPKNLKALVLNHGVTSNGEVVSKDGRGTVVVAMDTNARYKPFWADALFKHANYGFDVHRSGTGDYDPNDAKPYSISKLKDPGKEALRNYVKELIPSVVEGLTTPQLDEVIENMDFKMDYDWGSDNHYRLAIPGVDDEGKIENKTAFNNFLSKVNRIKLGIDNADGSYNTGNNVFSVISSTQDGDTVSDTTMVGDRIPVD